MVCEKLLSKHQLNKLGILKGILNEARRNYIESVEIYMTIFNGEPMQDVKSLFDFDTWRHRLELARVDMIKQFSIYNKAFNSYTSYYSVCLGR